MKRDHGRSGAAGGPAHHGEESQSGAGNLRLRMALERRKAQRGAERGAGNDHAEGDAAGAGAAEGGETTDGAGDEHASGAGDASPEDNLIYQDMMRVAQELAPRFEPFGLTLSPEILLAIARQESGKGLDPNQVSFDHGLGLMQLTPSRDGKLDPEIAETIGWDNSKSLAANQKAGGWKNVLGNIRGGALTALEKARYLATSKKTTPVWKTMTEHQRWRAVLYAYNSGQANAAKALIAGGADAKMVSRFVDSKGHEQQHDYTAEIEGNLAGVEQHDPFGGKGR